jgi:hypothetical protein
MPFSYLDPSENVGIPPPMPHAGLYAPDAAYTQTQWSKDYRGPRIEPDAVAYASHFYAPNHIPTYTRPGNNSILNNPFKFSDTKYNSMCYAP